MDIATPSIEPGMTPEEMQAALQTALKTSLANTQATFKSNSDIINARRAQLLGTASGTNLSPAQGEKANLLMQMIQKTPIILDPLIGFAAVLVKADMENMAAMAANPNVIIDFNKWLKAQGVIPADPA